MGWDSGRSAAFPLSHIPQVSSPSVSSFQVGFRPRFGNLGCGGSTRNPDSGGFSLPLDFRFPAFRSDFGPNLGCGRSTRNPDSGDFRSLPANFRSLPADFRSLGFRLSGGISAPIWAVAEAHGTRIPVISALFPPISALFPPISARSVSGFPVGFRLEFGLWQEHTEPGFHGFPLSSHWFPLPFSGFQVGFRPGFRLWQEHTEP